MAYLDHIAVTGADLDILSLSAATASASLICPTASAILDDDARVSEPELVIHAT